MRVIKMILGKIIGNVVSTIKLPILKGYKLMIVQPIDNNGNPKGNSLVALDVVQSGVGDTVIVIDEGNSSRLIINDSMAPVRSVIVGVVDSFECN
jgi:microcompartment protein CcmK/EutM